MAKFRVERTKDYTVMSNFHLRDRNLSLKSKGLLSMMLSLPDEWNYTNRGLAAICKEGVDAIGSALRELEAAGYIIRTQLRDEKGRISDTEYVIYEQPQPRSEPPEPRKKEPGTPKAGSSRSGKTKAGKSKSGAPVAKAASASDPGQYSQIPCGEKSEKPRPDAALPDTLKPYTEIPDMVIPYPVNTEEINIDKENKDRTITDRSNTESIPFFSFSSFPSVQSEGKEEPKGTETVTTQSTMGSWRNLVLSNIEYEHLAREFIDRKDELDEIVELIVETVSSNRRSIRVSSGNYDMEVVRQRFLSLNSDHVRFIMQCLQNNTTKIKNIKQYLLAVIFNSVTTISNYTAAQVNHDMASPNW